MAGTISAPENKMNPALKRFLTFTGKIVLVAVFATAAGWGWVYFFYTTRFAGSMLYKPSAVAVLGIFAGLISRLILRENTRLLRWLTAIVAVMLGLLFMHYGSTGLVGFWVFSPAASTPDWNGIWQLGLGGLLATVVLNIWHKPAPPASTPNHTPALIPESVLEPARITASPTSAVAAPTRKRKSPKKVAATTKAKKKQPVQKTKAATKSTSKKKAGIRYQDIAVAQINALKDKWIQAAKSIRTIQEHKTNPVKDQVIKVRVPANSRVQQEKLAVRTRPHRYTKSRRAKINLMGAEEHRCPYCLEDVHPRDPAGVVICPVCQTYHHKACWDITGTCQVPHSQS